MNQEEAKIQIARLSEEVNHHNYMYYVMAKPEISDYEFDMLLEKLIKLESEFPELIQPDSPSQRVGGQVTKEFKSVANLYPMLSLGNTYSEEELREFDGRVKKQISGNVEYVCELKFDGVSISLIYSGG